MLLLYFVRLNRQHIQGKSEWTNWPHEPATALRPLSDFTFQALQMVESCWVVDPSIRTNTLNLPNRAPTLDHLFAHDGNFQQWRNQAAKYDPQATTPDLFISAAEISEMKEAAERAPTPSEDSEALAGKTDAALVACACRQNAVSKISNLERNGGTLYYALALIKHVSEQEQPEARIGCLRAFAHQWPCQVELNPQFFPNFGCTDGEGVHVSLTAGNISRI
ncbi:BZ3500_MvSof-1268-A1-R1_Chr6-3g08843 [Microbotryum saponariae]|uniref:BZ3500_MvSof-1268-A1-R1_Chr6-3g08843 protein n=1 Tax=Microbotryum saponariae TaxID=289078 RepID=A0A2X0KJ86_9BASI|nr:BZ3500_MvSof-1268-A1-R1_Chr6-3g08843 [Microbotryum saponariae]SDA07444.1 BZ3501_MvSof-1269-A2-R1_Chr6-2g08546 [Microbotryum saponariae]